MVADLCSRECEVLCLVPLTNREIAVLLDISMSTVKNHLNHVYRKLGVDGYKGKRASALFRALALGLVEMDEVDASFGWDAERLAQLRDAVRREGA